MTKRGLVEIGIKLLGLYCFVQFLQFLPSLLMVSISSGMDEMVSNMPLYITLMCLYPLVHLILAYLFVMRTELILDLLPFSEKEDGTTNRPEAPAYGQFSFWIRIIGLYYFVSSAASVAALIPNWAINFSRSSTPMRVTMTGRGVWPELLILALSLFFIFKNQKVEDIITRGQSKDAPPEN